MIECDGWRPRLREWCHARARWAIVHGTRGVVPFVRCTPCARSYRADPAFVCSRIVE